MFHARHSRPIRSLSIMSVLCAMALGAVASAQAAEQISPVIKINEAAATSPIESTKVREGVTVLSGSGGNIGVITGADGKFMIDAGIAVSEPRLDAALEALDKLPLRYVVNTHYHWDHTDGNPWLAAAGAKIAATAGTVKRVSETTRVDDWNYTFKPLAKAGIPTIIVKGSKSWTFDKQTITAIAVPPSHTDTDLYVTVQPANVVFLGDLFWNGVYPFIDNENGGSITGMVSVLDSILPKIGDNTVVVPGHGPVGTKKDLQDFRDMLAGIRDNVAALKKQGKTRDEVIAEKPTAKWDAKYGRFVIDPDFFTRIVYDGLK